MPFKLQHINPVQIFVLLIFSQTYLAQPGREKLQFAGGDVFGTRVFIENKGQFNDKVGSTSAILYGYEHNLENIYFSKTGYSYDLVKPYHFDERDLERMERGKKLPENADKHRQVDVQWIGASMANIEVIADNKQSHYITYGAPSMNASTYKTLLYKNVYPFTDIEFVIPDSNPRGLKYTIHLHRGADISKIKLLYSGQRKHPKIQKSEALFIESGSVDITEQTPVSFYEDGGTLNSAFVVKGDTVMFALDANADTTRDICIDPYIATTSNFSITNFVYDIDYDYAGNSFVFGSSVPAKVAMYSSTGQLQWTFGGTIPALGWSTQPGGNLAHIGNFVVDKFSGKTYVSFALPNPSVIRLTLQGNYDNFITAPNPLFQELWEMSFHCSTGNILLLGGGHTSNLSAAQINPNTASVTLSTFNPTNTNFVHDMSAFTQDAQGNSFAYFATSNTALNNHITKVNSSYNGNVWTVPSGYNILAEADNKSVYTGNTVSSAGYNGMCANTNYLFYYDGLNLAAYNKATGSLVATYTFTNSIAKATGGIAVDDCNNVYVGKTGAITCLQFNGSQFNFLSSTFFPFPHSTSNTFDVKYNPATNLLYYAGANFCGSMLAPYSGTCAPNFGNCVFSQQLQMSISSSLSCSSAGSATAVVNSPQGNYTFLWLPVNTTGSVVTNIIPGIYTVVVTNTLTNQSYSVSNLLTASGNFSAALQTTSGNPCGTSNNFTLAANNVVGGSGQYSYSWLSNGPSYTTPVVSNVPLGSYTLMITDLVSNCAYIKSFTLTNPAPLVASINSGAFQSCVNNTLSLYAWSLGGTGTHSYQWSNGNSGQMAIVTSSVAGPQIFTVTVTDSLGCTASASMTIAYQPNYSVSVTNATICPNSTATITCSGAPTYSWNGVAGSNNFTLMTLQTTTVEFSAAFGICIAKATSTITVLPSPSLSISGANNVCIGKPLNIVGSGATSLVWLGPGNSPLIGTIINYSVSNFSHSGLYTLNGTMANGCSQTQTVLVTVHPNPTVFASSGNFCSNQALILNATCTNAATFQWYGPNGYSAQGSNPIINLPNITNTGSYSVIASSIYGCTNSAVATISVVAPPVFSLLANSPVCQYQSLLLQSSAVPASCAFNWSGPNGFASAAANPFIGACGMANAGTYTLTVTYGPCISTDFVSVIVYPSPQFVAKSSGTLCTADSLLLSVVAANDQNIQSYLWSGPLGFSSTQASTLILNATPANGGNYSITAVNNLGCPHTSIITVPVYAIPNVRTISDTACFNASALLIALGAPSYTWYNGSSALGNGPYLTFANASPLQLSTYTVIGTSAEGCTNSAIAQLMVLPNPTVTASSEQNKVCMFSNFTLNATGADFYTWIGGNLNGLEGKTQNEPANYPAGAVEFTVRGNNKFGCSAIATLSLFVLALPQASIVGGPFEACVPFCGNYSVTTSITLKTLEWQFDNGASKFDKQQRCFNKAGNFTASILFSDANDCVNSSTTIIIANPKPQAQFKLSTITPQELIDEVQIIDMSQGPDIAQWNWNLFESKTSMQQNFSGRTPAPISFERAGGYVLALEVVSDKGCKDTVVRELKVIEPFLIYVPNAFTPNADASNDVFLPVMNGVKEFTFQIYNRWGEEIFTTTDIKNGWNGSYKGSICKQDEYAWKLKADGINGERKEMVGSVLLYR